MDRAGNSKPNSLPRSALIVGAGVVGVATAYALARRGVAVTILDKAAGPGRGASFANGAQLSYVYTEALANTALLHRIPALALGLDPGFRLRPNFDPCQLSWLMRFLRNSTPSRFRTNTLAGLRLGLESRLAMHTLLQHHRLDFGHEIAGKMLVYGDAKAFAAARQIAQLKQDNGAILEILTQEEAIRAEPALAERPGKFAGAIHSPMEELGDPHRFCTTLMHVINQDYGADVKMNTNIEKLDCRSDCVAIVTDSGERVVADQLVLCAGINARPFLKRLGLGGAIMPMKGYSFTAPNGKVAPKMSVTDVSRKIVFCPLDGKMRVAGLAELGEHDTSINAKRLALLKFIAADSLPDAADYRAANDGWAGIRPMTANSLPIIRRVAPRVTVNVGHGMLGWTYAMGSAERVAQAMGV